MTPLNDEQIEAVLQGRRPYPADMDAQTAGRLAERRAIRQRLRGAFASVTPDEAWASTLRQRLRAEARQAQASRRRAIPFPFRGWKPIAAAAALLLAVGAAFVLTHASPAGAADFFESVHAAHLADNYEPQSDPQKVAARLGEHVGKPVRVPAGNPKVNVEGCCTRKFKDRTVGAYLIRCGHGKTSILILPQTPRELGLGAPVKIDGRDYWQGAAGKCRYIATRLPAKTYVAVSRIPRDVLLRCLREVVEQD